MHEALPRIRRLERQEVTLLRELRLNALADSPSSFGPRYEDAAAKDEDAWRRLIGTLTAPGPNVAFVGLVDGRACGLVFGAVDVAVEDSARVGGMWVDPGARRRGVGRLLLTAVLDWAMSCSRPNVGLWAPAHEPAALALYRRAGFREVGVEKLHRPGMVIVEMRLGLDV